MHQLPRPCWRQRRQGSDSSRAASALGLVSLSNAASCGCSLRRVIMQASQVDFVWAHVPSV